MAQHYMEDLMYLPATHGMVILILPGGIGREVHNGHSQLVALVRVPTRALTRAREVGNDLSASRLDKRSMTHTGVEPGECHAPRPLARATSTRVREHSLIGHFQNFLCVHVDALLFYVQ